ncbi:MAG: thiamine biosynthesis protein [Frankiales bacterium]|nr:thiamine biosynthesis protein [Frankiales bacterium]
MTVTAARPTRHVEHCMGTVFSFAVADEGDWTEAIADAVGWLHQVDATFSTYRPDSAVSRLRRGEDVHDPLVDEVLSLCERYERETDGAFSAHLPGGLDPSGLVKGWAVEWASGILREHGSANHAVSGGGDMQLAGAAAPGRPWRVGIADPFDPTRVLTTIEGTDLAVATSGTAERGAHLVEPGTGEPARALASVTVTGPSLAWVDVAATAAFVKGQGALDWLRAQRLGGIVVDLQGTVTRTG